MDVIEKIKAIIEPSLAAMGYDIVQVKMSDGKNRKTLTIMAERADGVVMGFDDCTEISRTVSALLDVEDPINSAYNLEVCSPGIDRPLTKLADYTKYKGYEAKLETFIPADGRKRFRGVIQATQGNDITLATETGEQVIGFNNIRSARLMMNEALIADSFKQQKKRK